MACKTCGQVQKENDALHARIAELENIEPLVQLVRDAGLATGHADDAMSLMREVLEQHEDRRKRIAELERENEALKQIETAHRETEDDIYGEPGEWNIG